MKRNALLLVSALLFASSSGLEYGMLFLPFRVRQNETCGGRGQLANELKVIGEPSTPSRLLRRSRGTGNGFGNRLRGRLKARCTSRYGANQCRGVPLLLTLRSR
jgi:hypothetical protein